MWVFCEYILMMIKKKRRERGKKIPFLKNVLREGGSGLSVRLEQPDCEQQQLVSRRPTEEQPVIGNVLGNTVNCE